MSDNILHRRLGLRHIVENIRIRHNITDNTFPYTGIYLAVGGQGVGKTLYAVNIIRDLYRKYPNVRIVSNTPLFGIPYEPYEGIQDLDEKLNGTDGTIFLIDEIQTLYCALKTAKLDESRLAVWSQNRKNRRMIIGTSQRFNRVEKPIREQTAYVIELSRPIFTFYPYRVYDGYLFNDEGQYTEKRPSLNFYVPNSHTFFMYDTNCVIQGKKGVTNE